MPKKKKHSVTDTKGGVFPHGLMSAVDTPAKARRAIEAMSRTLTLAKRIKDPVKRKKEIAKLNAKKKFFQDIITKKKEKK